MNEPNRQLASRASYGIQGLTAVDRLGTWLSRRAIHRELGSDHGLAVMELGCGFAARNLVAIEDRASRLVAIDFNLSADLKSRAKFEALELAAIPALEKLAGASFDLILLISVLEHLDDPLEVLWRCRELLKPGGKLLINVPTWRGKLFLEFSAFRLGWSPKTEMDDHKMYYDKKDLWPLLVAAHFLPSRIRLQYHKFGLNLFAVVSREH
jgi:SAM-dependent methyltransferase